jgi:hypothetical protein
MSEHYGPRRPVTGLALPLLLILKTALVLFLLREKLLVGVQKMLVFKFYSCYSQIVYVLHIISHITLFRGDLARIFF